MQRFTKRTHIQYLFYILCVTALSGKQACFLCLWFLSLLSTSSITPTRTKESGKNVFNSPLPLAIPQNLPHYHFFFSYFFFIWFLSPSFTIYLSPSLSLCISLKTLWQTTKWICRKLNYHWQGREDPGFTTDMSGARRTTPPWWIILQHPGNLGEKFALAHCWVHFSAWLR